MTCRGVQFFSLVAATPGMLHRFSHGAMTTSRSLFCHRVSNSSAAASNSSCMEANLFSLASKCLARSSSCFSRSLQCSIGLPHTHTVKPAIKRDNITYQPNKQTIKTTRTRQTRQDNAPRHHTTQLHKQAGKQASKQTNKQTNTHQANTRQTKQSTTCKVVKWVGGCGRVGGPVIGCWLVGG